MLSVNWMSIMRTTFILLFILISFTAFGTSRITNAGNLGFSLSVTVEDNKSFDVARTEWFKLANAHCNSNGISFIQSYSEVKESAGDAMLLNTKTGKYVAETISAQVWGFFTCKKSS
tara:strand:- start:45 stop:395 length:351 start_codon:yes stop_codon:yes gene_type:complete